MLTITAALILNPVPPPSSNLNYDNFNYGGIYDVGDEMAHCRVFSWKLKKSTSEKSLSTMGEGV